jgi:hypothetical protein
VFTKDSIISSQKENKNLKGQSHRINKKFFGPVAARLDRLIRCLDSSLVECPPATQAVGFRIPVNTCLSRDAFLKDGESLGQVST